MSSFRVGQVVELFCFWGEKEKSWNRGTVVRVAGVDDHLFKAKMPTGFYVIQLSNKLNFDGPCMLLGQEDDVRAVSPLQLLAEI